jgi:hypothetical protein
MKMIKTQIIVTMFITTMVLLSGCKAAGHQLPIESNFPLKQAVNISSNEEIERMAVSDTWMAIQTSSKLIGLDINSQERLWSVDFKLWYTRGTKFQIVNDNLIAASRKEIILVNREGQATNIALDLPNEGSIIRLVAVYPNYLYVITGPDWLLQVYDITQNSLLWKTTVGRGGADVFYDAITDIAYITTRDYSIRAFENSTGKLLWEQEKSVLHSIYEAKILYMCEPTDSENTYRFSALDVVTQKALWSTDIEGIDPVYTLSILNNLLLTGTGDGMVALNKADGKEKWHTLEDEEFFTSPVEFGNTIFVKGSSHVVYAISPYGGRVIGLAELEKKTI